MHHPSASPLRVLLIEDNPGDVFLLREMVNEHPASLFRVIAQTDDLASGLELIREGEVDVALLDLTLPDCTGLDCFRQVHAAAPQLPIIVLSGSDDEELALQAVHLGAHEYLVKGRIDTHLIQRSLRYAVERSRAEAELARERDILHTLLDNVPDRIYFKDEESRFILINHALTTLFQLTRPEDAYGRTDADFYGPEHAQEALEDERRVMESGEPVLNKVEFETLIDGTRCWSLTTKLPLRDRQSRIVGTCGISRSITELKEMEQQLSTERNFLRAVLENLPDIIFLKDREGRYLLDNAAHFRSLGASASSEVLGRTVFDFFPQEIAADYHENDLGVIRSGEAQIEHEERTVDRGGRPRWALTTKVPWRDEAGEILGLVGIRRDITEQREAQENLRAANAELARSREEVLNAMGRLQQAHQDLREVQLQLIEAEKLKSIGRLAAGIAHEVKNPLAVLKMGVELLRQQPSTDSAMPVIIKEMADAVERADGVIRGLLDFSAPQQLQRKRENLNEIIEQSLKLVRGEMGGGLEVARELQPNLPPVALDAVKISQVFVNLLTNALHAMPTGGTLTVRTFSKQLTGVGANIAGRQSESFRVGGQIVVAEIDDTGTGIPEDKLTKIFEPFFTTKPTGLGTGLGLSVVKTIIDLHGGTIDIRNLPDEGARVTIMFQV